MRLSAATPRSFFFRLLAILYIAASAYGQGTGYWHTQGNKILDANNQQVRIAGINWYGFETTDAVVHGLTSADYKAILQTIQSQGYNTVRIPFSNQVIETPTSSSNLNIAYSHGFNSINTDLQGLNSLQILDKIVDYAGTIGLKIILDNHRSEAGNSAESNGLWYTSAYPESNWINDWVALANRYAGNPTVIGFDLRNEPHNAFSGGACWDCGGANDWHLAAQRAGNAVQAVNPKLLLIVEGTDAYTNSDYYWWGGNLEGVANSPVTFAVPNQLVYSAHDYGPTEYQQSWFNGSTTTASLDSVWTQHWAFISQQGIAPVWLGEFGTTNSDSDVQSSNAGSEGQWFSSLIAFLHNDVTLNWTYWALNGEDNYGLLDSNYDPTPVDALKQQYLASNQFPLSIAPTSTPAPAAPTSLAANATSQSQIVLTWNASTTSGVTYTVYFGTSASNTSTILTSNVASTTYTATGLNPSTTYYFNVVASNSTGNSPASNQASATTQAAPVTAAPTSLTATATSSTQINLTWSPSSTANVTYSVYTGTSAGSINTLLASGLTGTTYQSTNLNPSTTYFYTVSAVASGSSPSTASNTASATTQAPPAPGAPTALTATAASSTQINLTWSASSTANVTYTVYSGTSPSTINSPVASSLNSTSYVVNNLVASTTYYFAVTAVSAGTPSAASNTASATTPSSSATVPNAPTGLSASATSASQINLQWQASTTAGVTYTIYTGTTSNNTTTLAASGITSTNYTVTGLSDGTTYYFTVKAVLNSNSSAASNQASATTQTAPPTPPTNLTATAASATQINLSWSAVSNTGATYAVYEGTSSGAENTLVASNIAGTTYQVTGLNASTTYYFVVRSITPGGTSAPSVQASATTQTIIVTQPTQPTTPNAPTAPSNLNATAVSTTQINLTWTASTTSGVTYNVYGGTGSGSTGLLASGLTGTAYQATGLSANTAYYFTVTAVSGSTASPASNQASATTQAAVPSAPTGLSATAISSTQINLTWSAVTGTGITYNLYTGSASGTETSLVASGITGTAYSATGLTASTTYFYIVKAVSAGGTSPASNEASAATQAAANGTCHVTYTDQNDWGIGFTGNISITNNTSTPITAWTLTWTYGGSQQIYTAWDTTYTQTGQKVTMTNASWNGTIPANGTTSGIGFNANYTGVNSIPTTFYLNGVACK